MKTAPVLVLVAALPSLACTARTTTTLQRPVIGVVAQFLDRRWCLAVADSHLVSGHRFRAASIPVDSSTPSSRGIIEVMGWSRDDCVWGGLGDLSYEVKVIDGALPPYPSGPSVAIVGGDAELIVTPSSLSTDIDGDGTLETFRACTSNEGLHLTLWAGPPLQGRRVWHTYFLLGYDVDPSCTPADYEGS